MRGLRRSASIPEPNAGRIRPGRWSWRRLLHSSAWLLAVLAVLAVFFVALLLAESSFYAITGRPLSTWALIAAALVAALLFYPMVRMLQRGMDRLFFRRHLDALKAIRELGAEDLADLPVEDVERALLARICKTCHRMTAALDERAAGEGGVTVWPGEAPKPPAWETPPLRLEDVDGYELCLPLPRRQGRAWLWLGPHEDGQPTEDDEVEALKGVARFAAMSLEHARLSRQLADRARLDSLSRVAGQLHSHDLKNRLNDLQFLAHNLEGRKVEAEDAARLVDAIRKVTGRMQMLMQRLADPRAPIHPELRPLDAGELVRRAVRARLWPEGVRVRSELPELPPVAADADLLTGVFETLFDNAVQAMQGQGELRVSASEAAGGIEFLVADTGCGMSREFMERRLFRLFSTSKEHGLGIGLYLSRRIVSAHGGRIWAESAGEGKGCTFHVWLPLWQAGGKEGDA